MKITFLGTAACEGFPAVFCRCRYCLEARNLKGKNIRTRSQALLNDDLLIDLPADTYHHFLQNDIEGDRIRYLLVTHSHSDHLYPNELFLRDDCYAHNVRAETLHVCCGTGAAAVLAAKQDEISKNVCIQTLKPFETVQLGDYTVTAFPARHYEGDSALFYLIQGDKTLLYAHDTGYFYEEVFTYLREHNITLDLISMDCTNVDIPISDEGSHMGLSNIKRLLARLTKDGVVVPATRKIINHFSHNANPLQAVLEARVQDEGYEVAFDGKCVQL